MTSDEALCEGIAAFNDKFGISLSGLSGGAGRFGHHYVSGEVHSLNEGAFDQPFRLMAEAIDDAGRIVGVGWQDVDGFFGLLAFEMYLGDPPEEARVMKYRVFPQPAR